MVKAGVRGEGQGTQLDLATRSSPGCPWEDSSKEEQAIKLAVV